MGSKKEDILEEFERLLKNSVYEKGHAHLLPEDCLSRSIDGSRAKVLLSRFFKRNCGHSLSPYIGFSSTFESSTLKIFSIVGPTLQLQGIVTFYCPSTQRRWVLDVSERTLFERQIQTEASNGRALHFALFTQSFDAEIISETSNTPFNNLDVPESQSLERLWWESYQKHYNVRLTDDLSRRRDFFERGTLHISSEPKILKKNLAEMEPVIETLSIEDINDILKE